MAGRRGHTLQADAGDRDKTLSCSCLVSKRKNFVSRARTTPLCSVVLPAWGWKSSSACCARQHRPRALAGCSPGSWGARPHGSHAARQHTETGQEAGRQQKQRVSTDLSKKEEHWKSLPRPVALLPGLLSVCWRGQTPISETRGSGEWLIRRLRLARHPRTAQ